MQESSMQEMQAPLTGRPVISATGLFTPAESISNEELVASFNAFVDRHNAAKALEQIGAPAEKGLLPLLEEEDWVTRMEVCKLLEKIGTPESLPQLERAAEDSNGLVKRFASQAIEAINKRQQ